MNTHLKASAVIACAFFIHTHQVSAQYSETKFHVEETHIMAQSAQNRGAKPAIYRSAAFPGGREALTRFLLLHHDQQMLREHLSVEGKIMVWFLIEKDGTILSSNIPKIKGESKLKITDPLASMPRWIPAQINGIPVRAEIKIPIDLSSP
jgi:hypothetical protein